MGNQPCRIDGQEGINEPFAVINADDFYGRDSFAVLGKQLSEMDGKKNDYCMVGYRVGNTLSDSGSVARGVCATNEEGYLTGVVERTAIERIDGDIQFVDENGKEGRIGRKYAGIHEYVGLHSRLLRVFRGIFQGVPKSQYG